MQKACWISAVSLFRGDVLGKRERFIHIFLGIGLAHAQGTALFQEQWRKGQDKAQALGMGKIGLGDRYRFVIGQKF